MMPRNAASIHLSLMHLFSKYFSVTTNARGTEVGLGTTTKDKHKGAYTLAREERQKAVYFKMSKLYSMVDGEVCRGKNYRAEKCKRGV